MVAELLSAFAQLGLEVESHSDKSVVFQVDVRGGNDADHCQDADGDDDEDVPCSELSINGVHFKVVKEFKVVGTMVAADCSLYADMDYKIAAATRAFFASSEKLMCKTVNIKERLSLLRRMVASVLLWCAETWNPTEAMIKRIDGFYTGLAARMLHWRKKPEQELG
eukprot:8951383-Karenia_brevis.AAC.1